MKTSNSKNHLFPALSNIRPQSHQLGQVQDRRAEEDILLLELSRNLLREMKSWSSCSPVPFLCWQCVQFKLVFVQAILSQKIDKLFVRTPEKGFNYDDNHSLKKQIKRWLNMWTFLTDFCLHLRRCYAKQGSQIENFNLPWHKHNHIWFFSKHLL